MFKKLLAAGLVAAIILCILAGAMAYTYLKPPAEASGPIEAIPVVVESAALVEAATDRSVEEGGHDAAAPAPIEEATEGAEALSTVTINAMPEAEAARDTDLPASPEPRPTAAEAPPTEESAPLPAAQEPLIFEIQQEGSQARYVIDEVLRGVPTTVVGATNQVAGQIAIDPAGAAPEIGPILINARTLATDNGRRDDAVRNRVLNTNEYEYITFTPSAIQGLPAGAAVGERVSFQVAGDLTIRDVTRSVTFEVGAIPVSESRLEGTAVATIRYAEWGISIPQVPFVAGVSDQVRLELDFVAAAS